MQCYTYPGGAESTDVVAHCLQPLHNGPRVLESALTQVEDEAIRGRLYCLRLEGVDESGVQEGHGVVDAGRVDWDRHGGPVGERSCRTQVSKVIMSCVNYCQK